MHVVPRSQAGNAASPKHKIIKKKDASIIQSQKIESVQIDSLNQLTISKLILAYISQTINLEQRWSWHAYDILSIPFLGEESINESIN